MTIEDKVRDYLFYSCSSQTIKDLSLWIEGLERDGAPKENKWIGVDIKLVPGTILNPPPFVSRFLNNG